MRYQKGDFNNIPTMQFFTGISRITQSKSFMLSLTECVWDFQNDVLWDSHEHALFMFVECYIPIQIIESKDFPLIYDNWSCLLPHLHITPTKDTVFCVIKEYSVTYLLLLYIVRTATHNAYFLSSYTKLSSYFSFALSGHQLQVLSSPQRWLQPVLEREQVSL